MDELDQMDQELEKIALDQRQNPRAVPPLPATFEYETILDDAATAARGTPQYKDVEYITIRVGVKDTVRREPTEQDKRMYAAQYLAWKKRETVPEISEGMPLHQWAAIPGKALVKTFNAIGVYTVEQLAQASETLIHAAGPYLHLRQQARDWVADAQKKAPLVKLRNENEALAARVKSLEEMLAVAQRDIVAARSNGGTLPGGPNPEIEALKATVAALAASMQAKAEPANGVPKRRGRPPKVTTPETES